MVDDARGVMRAYENGKIRVIWRPDLCAHSGVCVRGLAEVFRPEERPWIDLGGASSDRIVTQVEQCPSGALSWERCDPRPATGSVPMDVTRNDGRHRFEVTVDGRTGVLTYREAAGQVTLIHTEVPSGLRGRGIADALARAALDDARQRRLLVRPLCPFVQAFMKRHPEYADPVAPPAPPGGSR